MHCMQMCLQRMLRARSPSLHLPTYESGGVFNGDLDISGTTVAPRVAGTIGVPGGSLNGLPFINAHGQLEADRAGMRVQNGNVLVGSTQIAFSAAARERVNSFAFSTHDAILSDFDNYFDTGDTLSGTGPLNIAVLAGHRRFVTHGNVNVCKFTLPEFPNRHDPCILAKPEKCCDRERTHRRNARHSRRFRKYRACADARLDASHSRFALQRACNAPEFRSLHLASGDRLSNGAAVRSRQRNGTRCRNVSPCRAFGRCGSSGRFVRAITD